MTKTSNFAVLFAASGLAALSLTGSRPALAQTVIIDGAYATVGSTDLTAVGTTDWVKWGHDSNNTTFVQKGSAGANTTPVGYISNVTSISEAVSDGAPSGPDNNRAETGGGSKVSWSGGINVLNHDDGYLSSENDNQDRLGNNNGADTFKYGLGLGWSFDVFIPSMTTGTLYLYEGGYLSTDTLSVTSLNGTAGPSMSVDNLTGGNGYFTAAINNTASTSDTLSFRFYESAAHGQYDNPKIEAAALSLRPNSGLPSAAPEPSQFAGLGFAVLGVLGLLFKAKGRNKSANRSAATASV